jgi:hypothetical protein
MARTKLLATLSILIGLFTPLLLAEVALRFLPVRTPLETLPVNDRNPTMRFTPNREFTYSNGWNLSLVNRGRTNNYGFINNEDYDSTAHTPLLAVIGDSYVEALMVPFAETLQGRLARCVGRGGRVYSFGVSGTPLSQYLAEARYAKSNFRPGGIVVVIVGNDFDESLEGKASEGAHYFRQEGNRLVLDRKDYSPSLGRRLLRKSALARYLTLNLAGGVTKMTRLLRGKRMVEQRYVGNTEAAFTPERLDESRRLTDEFLTLLPAYSGVVPGHTVLVVDGMRPGLYSADGLKAASGSYFDLMRRYLIERGARGGFQVVDMQPRFLRQHALDGSRFESASDHHWSGRGHAEAARAVAASSVFRQLFPGACSDPAQKDDRAPRP